MRRLITIVGFFLVPFVCQAQVAERFNSPGDSAFVVRFEGAYAKWAVKETRRMEKKLSAKEKAGAEMTVVPVLYFGGLDGDDRIFDEWSKVAEWMEISYLSTEKMYLSNILLKKSKDYIVCYEVMDKPVDYVFSREIAGKPVIESHMRTDEFVKMYRELKPDYVFRIASFRSFFFIIGRHIIVVSFDRDNNAFLESSDECIKREITQCGLFGCYE